jgi:nitroreductase/ferredoxin
MSATVTKIHSPERKSMSWVSIDKERCNGCGLCALRCVSCFFKQGDEISAYADEATCNLCGHCLALCPKQAIRHTQMNPDAFVAIDSPSKFETDAFVRFIRERRSHRHFRDKAVPRAELEKLVDACRYAPTGGNRQPVCIKVVQNQDKIRRLSNLTVDYFARLFEDLDRQIAAFQAENKPIPETLSYTYSNMSRYKNIPLARDLGLDMILYNAPVVMMFHAESPGVSNKDDCTIAAHTATLVAMTMGLGSCYIGLFTNAAKADPTIMQELGLPPQHEVYTTLVLGYPRLKFIRMVERKPIPVSWD